MSWKLLTSGYRYQNWCTHPFFHNSCQLGQENVTYSCSFSLFNDLSVRLNIFLFFCSSRGCNFVSPPSPGGLLALVPACLTHQWLQEAVWKYWNNFSVRTRSTNEALLQISSCFIVLLGSWVSRCVLLVTTKASLTFYEQLASSTLTSSLHWLFALQEAFQRNRTSNHLLQSSLHSFNICVKKTVIML